MTSACNMILVDTNVWLDYCLPFRAGHAVALQLVQRCWESGTQMLIAATSTKDVFYITVADMKRNAKAQGVELTPSASEAIVQTAWALIDNIMQVATPLGIDTGDVWLAQRCERVHGDLEDDLLIAAALRCKADFIVTNDKELIIDSAAPAVTPQRLLELLGWDG